LYSKLVKKSLPLDTEKIEPDDYADSVAYFYMYITPDSNLMIEGDFLDENYDAMAKLVFLLCSGALSDFVLEIVQERCGDDVEAVDKIMKRSYEMVLQYLAKKHSDEEDDEDPVVDPCDVFNLKNRGEDDNDES
jgi:hypothetical protein